jgi:hypothetical protein
MDERDCELLRRHEPRGAHEHALLAQIPEFQSKFPSHERLRSIARDVERRTEEERRARSRAVVAELCPPFAEDGPAATVLGVGLALCLALLLLRSSRRRTQT